MINEKEQFVCDICGKVFPSKRSLGNHRSWCKGERKKPERKPQTKEAKKNISKALKGRKLSEEHIEAIKIAHPKQTRETRVCIKPDCDNTFDVLPSSKKKYCSPYCSRHDLKVPREKRYCKFCGKEFVCRVTDRKTCCNLNHQLAYRRTLIDYKDPERNKKISNTVSLQYISGTRECKNGYDEGWITLQSLNKEVYCRSSYEKDFLRNIDTEGLLENIESEPVRIPYEDEAGIER